MDWIDLVEPIYDLETPSHDAWLGTLMDHIGPRLGRLERTIGSVFHLKRDHLQVLGVRDNDLDYAGRAQALARARPDLVQRTYQGSTFNTMSGHVGRRTLQEASEYREIFVEAGDRDVVGLLARDGGAWGVCIAVGIPKIRNVTRAEAAPWERIAAHIHAAMRLRYRLHGAPTLHATRSPVKISMGIDAVVSPGGKIEHAEPAAQASLDALKEAAVSIDRARARMRREDPEGALDAWRTLVLGEWSLVETFESDGRRYLVARKNPPNALASPLLTVRERQMLGFYARAHAVKLIAYEMGLSPACVSRSLRSAKAKLGITSPAQLGPLLSPSSGEW
jgi:DNA-binding CsgD family transcriptional regulator